MPFKEYNAHICKCYEFAKDSTCIKLPEEDTFMQFKGFNNMLDGPYIVYAASGLLTYPDQRC